MAAVIGLNGLVGLLAGGAVCRRLLLRRGIRHRPDGQFFDPFHWLRRLLVQTGAFLLLDAGRGLLRARLAAGLVPLLTVTAAVKTLVLLRLVRRNNGRNRNRSPA